MRAAAQLRAASMTCCWSSYRTQRRGGSARSRNVNPLPALTMLLQCVVGINQRSCPGNVDILCDSCIPAACVCPSACRLYALYTTSPSLRGSVHSHSVRFVADGWYTLHRQRHSSGQLRQLAWAEQLQLSQQHGQRPGCVVPAARTPHSRRKFFERICSIRYTALRFSNLYLQASWNHKRI
jgi:hypothetical protein